MQRHRLKLTSLKFISSVDTPAQETAQAVLLKRGPNAPLEVKGQAKVLKVDESLGLVFAWAFTTKANGVEYYDLHGDNIIEADLIKVASEWMEAGGAADTMHDREQDGRAVFCMPMTTEVAKAFFGDKVGGELGTYGLMVAIKPSAEDFAKYKSGELAGLSIDGTGIREAVRSVSKMALYTTEIEGHQHLIDVACLDPNGTGYTSFNTAAGSEYGHSHAVARTADGFTILADSGHAHELAPDQAAVVVVPANAVVLVENSTGESTNQITMRAKSPAPIAAPKVDTMKTVVLSEAQHAHYQKLAPADAEAFLAKSTSDRDADIAKAIAADPVVFKGEKTGIEVRKSQGDFALQIAKQAETMAVTSAKQAEEIAKRDTEIKKARIRKMASEILKNAPGDDETHDFIVEQLEGNEKAMATIKGLVATSSIGRGAAGAGGNAEPTGTGPQAELEALISSEMTTKSVDRVTATTAVMKSTKGIELYTAIQAAKKAARA